MLLGAEEVAVYGVILRKDKAQSLLNPLLAVEAGSIDKAFVELANIWRQKKVSLEPVQAAAVAVERNSQVEIPEIHEGKNLQLELLPDAAGNVFEAFVWVTGGARVAWGKVAAK